MKTNVNLYCVAIASLSLATGAAAQSLTVLASFDQINGANPQAALVASGSTLYGTTYYGGSSNFGTVFSISTNGGVLSNLYSFNGTVYSESTSNYVTTDGGYPAGGLVVSGNMLYGTTSGGGTSDYGTVFAISTNGDSYAILHNFTGGAGGAFPEAGLVLSGSTLYGTTSVGGTAGQGSVFTINTSGGAFTNIHSFSGGAGGSDPVAGLVLSGNTLYGTTQTGGASGDGTVFRVNTDGSSFSNLYVFTGGTNGASPEAGLVLSGNTLYGTTYNGGDYFGTVFKVNTNGSGFSSFNFNGVNGANPQAPLILSGNTLLGTAVNGGSDGWGTLFSLSVSGGNFSSFYAFTDGGDGAGPEAGLLLLGNTLYGTTQALDSYGYYGTVFAITSPVVPQVALNIALQGTNKVTLSWADATFSLQSATNLLGVYTNVPGATSPYTNSITGKQKFFRLDN